MMRHEQRPNALAKGHELVEEMAGALAEAVEAVDPANSRSIYELFPEPGQRRADTEFSIPMEREPMFRAAMAKLGVGRETDLTPEEIGLQPGYAAVIDGGQARKILSELQLVVESEVKPGVIVLAATPERVIPPVEQDKAKEREVTAKALGIELQDVKDNEYDVALQVLESMPGFSRDGGGTIGFGYDADFNPIHGPEGLTGQLRTAGGFGNIAVLMLRIDRQHLEGGKYRQPGSRKVIELVDELMRSQNGYNRDIGFVTSSTYQPSRQIDAVAAMITIERDGKNRHVGVVTYGAKRLAEVTMADKNALAVQPDLGQLAGEAHKAAQQLEQLRVLLEAEPAS